MDTLFPFGLPGATQWYLTLYIVTLLMHVAFMNYVLAGTLVLAVGGLRGRLASKDDSVLRVLKDWMPFALSAAITAGIAPLLFIQVLYQREFYTSNLLLFHRWMAILPVLIVAFYLLYVIKAKGFEGRKALKGLATVITAMCILFVAWSWTENHLLSLDKTAWPALYASRDVTYQNPGIWLRLAVWVFGAFPTLAVLVAWQLRLNASGTTPSDHPRAARQLAVLGLAGLVLAMGAGGWYYASTKGEFFNTAISKLALPYTAAVCVGVVMQIAAWAFLYKQASLAKSALITASAGVTLTFIGVAVVREAIRLRALQPLDVARHADAAGVAGLALFLVFAAIALGAIYWVFKVVRDALKQNM